MNLDPGVHRAGACLGASLLLGLLLSQPARAQEPQPLTREALVDFLRHQEGLVRSAEATLETIGEPTTPADLRRIQQYCKDKERDENGYRRYHVTEEMARDRSNVTKWWRKGEKARRETFPLGQPPDTQSRNIMAFDGQLERSFNPGREGGVYGSIFPREAHGWQSGGDIWGDPLNFLFYYGCIPYSQIVADAQSFQSRLAQRDGQPAFEVTVSYDVIRQYHHLDMPGAKPHTWVLLFDRDLRLRTRWLIDSRGGEKVDQLQEIQTFDDYAEHPDPSGHSIWFPKRVTYRYCFTTLPDGTLVLQHGKRITVKDIRFNGDIPDDLFVLEFPSNAKVWDDLGLRGWVEAKDISKSEALFSRLSAERGSWIRRLLLALGSVVGVGVVVLVVRWVRQRKSRLA
jgi:hypothetical protein